jgi:HPt (histidine-containing phosphotransfer) domain-containing protein
MAENNAESDVLYINQVEGLKRVMNNTKLYIKLLSKFKADFKLDDLIAKVHAAHYEEAQTLVHTLKGTAANLSLTELAKQSLDLETQIKNKTVSPGSIDAIKVCFENTLFHIDMVIKQYA